MTAAQTQSFNAGFILLFAPVFAGLWSWLGRMNKDPNTVLKFGLALGQVGLGFLILGWGVMFANEDYKVPLIFLALAICSTQLVNSSCHPWGFRRLPNCRP